MPKDDTIEVEGIVTEVLPGTKFRVKLTNGHVITAYLAGKMRVHYAPFKSTGVGSHCLLQGIFRPRDQTQVSCISGRFFTV